MRTANSLPVCSFSIRSYAETAAHSVTSIDYACHFFFFVIYSQKTEGPNDVCLFLLPCQWYSSPSWCFVDSLWREDDKTYSCRCMLWTLIYSVAAEFSSLLLCFSLFSHFLLHFFLHLATTLVTLPHSHNHGPRLRLLETSTHRLPLSSCFPASIDLFPRHRLIIWSLLILIPIFSPSLLPRDTATSLLPVQHLFRLNSICPDRSFFHWPLKSTQLTAHLLPRFSFIFVFNKQRRDKGKPRLSHGQTARFQNRHKPGSHDRIFDVHQHNRSRRSRRSGRKERSNGQHSNREINHQTQ